MKKKYITLVLLLPSILVNYFTLTAFDIDHNLSLISTLIVTLFNVLNIFFVLFLKKTGLKKLLIISFSVIVLIIITDFSFQNFKKNNSYQIQNKEFGWILNNSIKLFRFIISIILFINTHDVYFLLNMGDSFELEAPFLNKREPYKQRHPKTLKTFLFQVIQTPIGQIKYQALPY